MTKILISLSIAVLIIGGVATWDLIPKSWFDRFPAWGQIALVICAIIFSAVMLLGHVLESGTLQRIFKRK
jgi:cytochrome b subunit of formate dehydrogenase